MLIVRLIWFLEYWFLEQQSTMLKAKLLYNQVLQFILYLRSFSTNLLTICFDFIHLLYILIIQFWHSTNVNICLSYCLSFLFFYLFSVVDNLSLKISKIRLIVLFLDHFLLHFKRVRPYAGSLVTDQLILTLGICNIIREGGDIGL